MKTARKPYFIIYILVFIAIIAVDRFTKHLVTANMQVGEAIPNVEAFFSIHYVRNDGVAFSLLQGNPELLIVLQSVIFALITCFLVVAYIKKFPTLLLVALTFVISGGAGNLIDRVQFHYVIDFISVGSFPIWNVADMAVVGGCILIAIYILFAHGKEKSEEDEGELEEENAL